MVKGREIVGKEEILWGKERAIVGKEEGGKERERGIVTKFSTSIYCMKHKNYKGAGKGREIVGKEEN